jgi:hypothetical protein
MPYIPNPTAQFELSRGLRPSNSKLAVPVVHLNGTGKTGLVDPIRAAYSLCEDLLKALSETAPHMRDYYVAITKTPSLYEDARAQYRARVQAVANIQDELEVLATAIQQQGR